MGGTDPGVEPGIDPGVDPGFVHHACLYGTDEEFLATALPFALDGLAAGEPVLAATTPANIELLRRALGERAGELGTAETAYFGRRPVERVSAFLRYHDRRSRPGRRLRILAEPVWAGKSARQIAEWKRMESGLNVLLAGLPVRMICPYDTRAVPGDIAHAARATHPARVDGRLVTPCAEFTDPEAYAAAVPPPRLPAPPGAARTGPTGRLAEIRSFARDRAGAAGLRGERLGLAVLGVCEAAGYLLAGGGVRLGVRAWEEPGTLVYELLGAPVAPVPAFAGFRPPGAEPHPEDGLWLARTIGESLDVHVLGDLVRLTLCVAGPRASNAGEAEFSPSGAWGPGSGAGAPERVTRCAARPP
ncbi:MEDS domain-containing protein [Streptomyces hesseae]|uniref:MEDS domain-containing protein n=1 Tax=Streptomyces hesseae TaxID=3075519 RepID=A0ABU2SXU9_9ACTN|nr:MEDS domain-containing protein [Streptomyces sp. DSM 40473]MDT0453543.1 MEDS domain-containing protein [Streptomyces sp. DSM 40473]